MFCSLLSSEEELVRTERKHENSFVLVELQSAGSGGGTSSPGATPSAAAARGCCAASLGWNNLRVMSALHQAS